MTTQQARAMLTEGDAEYSSVVEAAAIVCRSAESTPEDLLRCLDHGGLAAEFAAMELYRRTKQPRPKSPLQLIVRRLEWESILRTNRSKDASKARKERSANTRRRRPPSGI